MTKELEAKEKICATKMTPRDLSEIKARADAATPGPWALKTTQIPEESLSIVDAYSEPIATTRFGAGDLAERRIDAAFISRARTDIPRLLEYVEELMAALEWMMTDYRATFRGKPVRDADECFEAARAATGEEKGNG